MTLHETPWMVDIFVPEDWKAIDFTDREISQSWTYLEPEASGESPTKYYIANKCMLAAFYVLLFDACS